ncbi:MAG: membrane protein insertion efficiency factor YidD [Vicinamibacterales bacterium]
MSGAFAGAGSLGDVPGPAARVLLGLLAAYKLLISPYFAGSCRFLPSCADYAREAVLRHGALRGGWLAARRLARCHPLCESGHDPVPTEPRRHSSGRIRSLRTAR